MQLVLCGYNRNAFALSPVIKCLYAWMAQTLPEGLIIKRSTTNRTLCATGVTNCITFHQSHQFQRLITTCLPTLNPKGTLTLTPIFTAPACANTCHYATSGLRCVIPNVFFLPWQILRRTWDSVIPSHDWHMGRTIWSSKMTLCLCGISFGHCSSSFNGRMLILSHMVPNGGKLLFNF